MRRHPKWAWTHFFYFWGMDVFSKRLPPKYLGRPWNKVERMMKGSDLLRIVDQMHHEKNIDREIIFEGIEAALQLATQKELRRGIRRRRSPSTATPATSWPRKGEEDIDPAELGRIAAQSAKQVMIQKIREAECNAVFDEYAAMKGDLVHGPVARHEGGAAIVTLGKTEAILPRSEQIPGETHHVGERIKAVGPRRPQGRATGSRSSCRARTPTSCAGCSRTRSPKSPTAPSRSRPSPARPATAPRSPSPAST